MDENDANNNNSEITPMETNHETVCCVCPGCVLLLLVVIVIVIIIVIAIVVVVVVVVGCLCCCLFLFLNFLWCTKQLVLVVFYC